MTSQLKKPSSCPELYSQLVLRNPSMESDTRFQNFRSSYHAFRSGASKGAKGELSAVLQETNKDDATAKHKFETILGSDGLSYEDHIDMGYAALCEYRLAYRSFRLGAAFGSKGEFLDLASRLSVRDCMKLPVSRLSEFRKQLSKRQQVLQKNDCEEVTPLHLHFGAGRLGLGLILPAMMRSNVPFVIVQRPSAAWANVLKVGHSEVRLNGSTLATLDVISNIGELDNMLHRLGKRSMLLLSEDPAVLSMLVSRATSYSCSIGGDLDGALAPLVESVRAVHADAKMCIGSGSTLAPAPLYACENDHEAVATLAKKVTGLVEIVPVLVDRVCTAREMREDGSIDVATEIYEGDLVLSPCRGASANLPIPCGGCTLRQPETEEGAAFLHRKKILSVNGTHTTLAFLTLVQAEPGHVGPPKGSYELLAFDIDTAVNDGVAQNVGRMTWVWVVARQLILLYEFEEDIIRHTLSGEKTQCDDAKLVNDLLSGARTAVKRLSGGGDSTSRVLGGGVANRWRTRLANVQDFLQAQQTLGHLSKFLLAAAGVCEEELRTTVKQLVEDSEGFTILPPQDFQASTEHKTKCSKPLEANSPAVLLDSDGTLGDTEALAMEMPFWEIAPDLRKLLTLAYSWLEKRPKISEVQSSSSPTCMT
jgi:hypothetical protein